LRFVGLLGLPLTVAGAGLFAFLAWVREDSGDALSAASTLAIITGVVAACALAARSRILVALAACGQAAATVWIAVAWERAEGFTSGGGDSGSLELAPIILGMLIVDSLALTWAATSPTSGGS
jgi:hypothetical protein